MMETVIRKLRLVSIVAILLATLGGLLTVDATAAVKPQRSFFGSVEVRSSNLAPFKKWRAALARYSNELKHINRNTCQSPRLKICNYGQWATFLKSLKGLDKFTQIRAVNARMNKAEYITDKTNWGQNDYWATPGEFMARFGDCEDFAIVKYLSLRLLGFPENELRVVAVKDLNLKIGHAVLIVMLKDPKTGVVKDYVLDNQIKQVVEAKTIRHYEPVFSINRNFWWRHRRG